MPAHPFAAHQTLRERALHALLYELCAMALLVRWAVGCWATAWRTGALALWMSATAMLWNMLFGALFERLEAQFGRTPCGCAACMPSVLKAVWCCCVPVVAWWLQVSYWQALWLDIGVLLFFLPYTWLFNWLATPAHGVRGPWRKAPCNMVMIDGLSAEYAPGHRQNRRAWRRGGRSCSCWRFHRGAPPHRRATSSSFTDKPGGAGDARRLARRAGWRGQGVAGAGAQ